MKLVRQGIVNRFNLRVGQKLFVGSIGSGNAKCAGRFFGLTSVARGNCGYLTPDALLHVIVFQESSLRRILASYLDYYHRSRTHLSLGKDSPEPRGIQPPEMGSVVALPQVG